MSSVWNESQHRAMTAVTDSAALERLAALPRVPLAGYPTRLAFLPRLSRELGRPVYIKRDDEIGPGLGGNKTRKLEFLLADALARGHRKVATFGGRQSNHARLTAAAARQLGLEPHLFYFEPRPATFTGNLMLNRLLAAPMHFVPIGGGNGSMTIEQTIRLVRLVAWARLGRHYFIPVGGHTWLGALGYVVAAAEIDAQARAAGMPTARLVVAAGSGGTLAGLMAGLAITGSGLELVGIDVGRLWRGFPASIAGLANDVLSHLGVPAPRFGARDVPLIEERYVGERYGVPSVHGQEAIRRLACAEGILLDPIYTGKAFAALLDMARPDAAARAAARDEPLIFLHTGGIPALFAFPEAL